jgi:PKHD-type hydroxylase
MYYLWDSVISKDDCERIIDTYKDKNLTEAKIVVDEDGTVDDSIRTTKVTWINNKLITMAIWGFLDEGNRNYFKYDIVKMEDTQFAEYTKGSFYSWHTDDIGSKSSNGSTRKLSSIVLLSSTDNFKGGDFEFSDPNGNKKMNLKQGSVILFNSSEWHRVGEITDGVRYTLSSWFRGPKFR